MKMVRLFTGCDSLGRDTYVAESESGAWFCRVWARGYYGYRWTSWHKLEQTPTFPTEVKNQVEIGGYDEMVQIEPGSRIDWGFKTLSRFDHELPKFRLPG